MSEARRLTLYYRSGCSLCEEMQGELLSLQLHYGFQLKLVDVDAEPANREAFGHKVPVLTGCEGEDICHYFLDRAALDEYFSGV